MNYITSLLARIYGASHFAVAFAANTGIGMTPIMYYGNEGQKKNTFPNWLAENGKHVIVLLNLVPGLIAIQAAPKRYYQTTANIMF